MKSTRGDALKVCLIAHGLGSSGVEAFIVSLATGLKNKGFDVKLVTSDDDNGIPQFREQEIKNANVEIFRTNDLDKVSKWFTHMRRLYKYLKQNRFDVVHSNMNMFNGVNLAVAWFAGVKIRVAHIHNVGSEKSNDGKASIAQKLYKIIMRLLVLLFANRKCAVSYPAAESGYGQAKNVSIIHNGIDIKLFAESETKKRSPKSVITVGRLAAIKNPELIIKIMGVLEKKGYTLEWVGGGALEAQIRKEIEESELTQCIAMLGVRKDVNELLQTASVFLLPSISEGFSIATLEAQAAGLPCVISDTVPREVDCGLCTFLSLDESPDAWAETIDSIATGRVVKKLDADKLEKFSTEYMVEQVIKMYGSPVA